MTTAVVVYDPRFLTWERWSALTQSAHLQHGPASILRPVPEERWREWAQQFTSPPDHAGDHVPDPRGFRTWQDWALAVNHLFYLM